MGVALSFLACHSSSKKLKSKKHKHVPEQQIMSTSINIRTYLSSRQVVLAHMNACEEPKHVSQRQVISCVV